MAGRLITVTLEDIANGKRDNCGYCPIALAMDRELGGQNWAAFCLLSSCPTPVVGDKSEKPEHARGDYIAYETPPIAQKFINDFDMGRPVRPFSFYLKRSEFFK